MHLISIGFKERGDEIEAITIRRGRGCLFIPRRKFVRLDDDENSTLLHQ